MELSHHLNRFIDRRHRFSHRHLRGQAGARHAGTTGTHPSASHAGGSGGRRGHRLHRRHNNRR